MMGFSFSTPPGFRAILTGLLLLFAAAPEAQAQGYSIEAEPILYGRENRPLNDPVARLQEKLARGETHLKFDEEFGYLPSLLEHLGIPRESQMLVFSKTSFQAARIFPKVPRAVYFNDEVYVGFVRGGDVLELSAVDPQQGINFYSMKQWPSREPRFSRLTHDCLQCHASSRTHEPVHLVRSVYPGRDGRPVLNLGSFITTPSSPLKERWGGWYVSGTHGHERHMGNVLVDDPSSETPLDMEKGANVEDLSRLTNTWMYLTPHSDIVALMVLEHQAHVHNVLTFANYHVRQALHRRQSLARMLQEPENAPNESFDRALQHAGDKVLRAILMDREVTFDGPIRGTSGFAEVYRDGGKRDSQGRSLRDLDLQRRLFEYPCSPVIHSPAFRELPAPLLEHLYVRLHRVLTGQEVEEELPEIDADDRRTILEILRETQPDLPGYWMADQPEASDREAVAPSSSAPAPAPE